jgi:hypothetical protein
MLVDCLIMVGVSNDPRGEPLVWTVWLGFVSFMALLPIDHTLVLYFSIRISIVFDVAEDKSRRLLSLPWGRYARHLKRYTPGDAAICFGEIL